jgi:LmbE family N-acetylglucosaminyl deacetylase
MEIKPRAKYSKFMLIVVIIFLSLITLVWISGFIYANDFRVPSIPPSGIKKALVIFPHLDDEALTSGGFISNLSSSGVKVYWVVLTKGEKGTPDGKPDERLKAIRVKEANNAAHIYGVTSLEIEDYPDGGVSDCRDKLTTEVNKILKDIQPDLVITYDLAGLYGHPDHIVTSEVVTDVIKGDFPSIKLWYAAYPKRILTMVALPEHMAKDKSYKNRRVYPTQKVWVGLGGVVHKIKAVYAYASQKESYTKSFPVKWIPLWFYISLTPFEYYHEAKLGQYDKNI